MSPGEDKTHTPSLLLLRDHGRKYRLGIRYICYKVQANDNTKGGERQGVATCRRVTIPPHGPLQTGIGCHGVNTNKSANSTEIGQITRRNIWTRGNKYFVISYILQWRGYTDRNYIQWNGFFLFALFRCESFFCLHGEPSQLVSLVTIHKWQAVKTSVSSYWSNINYYLCILLLVCLLISL